MNKTIRPSTINGIVKAPPSKSAMQRAIAASILDINEVTITNPSFCKDSLAALQIAEALGKSIERKGNKIQISQADKQPIATALNCGESGLCMRMLPPVLALFDQKITLSGTGSLLSRPASMIEEPLLKLGAECKTENGYPPITTKGPIKGGTATVDGSLSSQFLTGLLLALPKAEQDSIIKVSNLKSRPYIDLTLRMIKKFGIEIENDNYKIFHIKGNQIYNIGKYEVEGDWSGASFLLVAGAIAGEVCVKGLDLNSSQADKQILAALKSAGAKVETSKNTIKVSKSSLRPFEFDATDSPDLFPPLAVLALNCNGVSRIRGVERLKHKESNREAAIIQEFTALGGEIHATGDIMSIYGSNLKGGIVNPRNDHRIAMAAATAALCAREKVIITDAECVEKSYPGFFKDLALIGVEIYE